MRSDESPSTVLDLAIEGRLTPAVREPRSDRLSVVTSQTMPRHRVVILGAGRSVRGDIPSAMVNIDHRGRVLDWLLAAFSRLPAVDVTLVGGYKAHAITDQYRDIRFVYNADWDATGPARSLSLSPLASADSTYISYADVVFRAETVQRMESVAADVVVAADRTWRTRYDGRTRSELDVAEKIACTGDRLIDMGRHVPTPEAAGEFAGLLKLSGATALRLQNVIRSGVFDEKDGLPEIIRFLIRHNVSIAVVEVDGQWAELNAPQDLARFVLGTKAESLERLRPLVQLGHIGELVSFTQCQWQEDRLSVLNRIQAVFSHANVIVRSSARNEDGWNQSSAGAHTSILDVSACDLERLASSIDEVIESYGEPRPDNQVLVQEMLTGVTISGVVMTRTPSLGAPYYVINYDDTTSRTDTVTSGEGTSLRTLFLHRGASLQTDYPRELHLLIEVIREIEQLVGHDSLDIEFAVTADGRVHVLQVRPIAVTCPEQPIDDTEIAEGLRDAHRFFHDLQRPSPFLLGDSTQLSVMSDWNPAEIVGTKPNRLAFSLYRYLITDETWALQRAQYGYRDVRPCHLLVDLLGHPYVDVRATFNSFVPASLPDDLAKRLVEHYLAHLKRFPELHDKVEFDILFTCLAFDFDRQSDRLREAGFSKNDIDQIRESLRVITRDGIARCSRDLAAVTESDRRFRRIQSSDVPPLERAFLLLDDARLHGVLHFAHSARGAFVAVSLLRSLVAVGITTEEQTNLFLSSLRTVSSDLRGCARCVANCTMTWDEFVELYSHLRPGTYDISSPHYGSAPVEYLRPIVQAAGMRQESFLPGEHPWDAQTKKAITAALDRSGLGVDADGLDRFLRQAIEGREFSKFTFTRNLNAALESLATFGAEQFISREELAHIPIHDLFELRSARAENVSRVLKRLARQGREASYVTQAVCLPCQVFSATDLVCFEQPKAVGNYVTQKCICADVVPLSSKTCPEIDLAGKIVLTPNADPGFDWIFGRNIAGLITMYGGSNSHMAIRAAEFGLPAAIGVGEMLYSTISTAAMVELNCSSRQIRVVG